MKHNDNTSEFDARDTYKAHIARAIKMTGGTPNGQTVSEPIRAVQRNNRNPARDAKSIADKYISSTGTTPTKEAPPSDTPKKTVAQAPKQPEGAEWMDRWHVGEWHKENPQHAHLSGEEAYNKYAVDRATKILNFHKRVDFLKSFIPSKLHQSASKVVPHAHVDDAGLHHFNAIPKDTFIKHWNSITTKNGT